jgi:hypothetical protein
MPRNANAKRDDGQLHITYNEMGQGDNILIACPNGQVVVIDCGAARWDGNYFTPPARPDQLREKAVKLLFEPCFLGNNQTVNALILTHADKDHCNELKSLFDHTLTGTPKVAQIDALYFSGSLNDYIEGSATNYLTADLPPAKSYAITVNATECKLNDRNIPNSATAEIRKKSLQAATQGFIKIIDGTKAGGAACNVYILASNVRSYAGINDGYGEIAEAVRNRSSVVTMVVYGDKKFLFLGDATFHTEKFLKDTYGARIADVEMLHVGHHASYRTSSSYINDNDTNKDQAIKDIDFISHVNPRILAVSAAYDSGSSLKLPRWETIANYIAGANRLTVAPAHRIHCWWHVPGRWSDVPIGTRVVPKITKPKKVYIAAYNEVGYKATNRHILCTGTDGVLDFDYHARSAGGGRFIVEPAV